MVIKMNKFLLTILISFVMSFSVFATTNENKSNALYKTNASVCAKLKSENKQDTKEYVQRGCCSWHGGVCGCTGGRVVCCDSTYSPSCLCDKEDSPEVTN